MGLQLRSQSRPDRDEQHCGFIDRVRRMTVGLLVSVNSGELALMPGRDVKPLRRGRRDGNGRDVIIAAALKNFYERGYHGTSVRDIAVIAEMTPASLYYHFSSKEEILRVVMTLTMHDVLSATRVALLRAGGSPREQLAALMKAWILFHADRQIEARVQAAELHSLDSESRVAVVALRDEQERLFVDVIQRGVQDEDFATPYPRESARAVINMGTAVATWFDRQGSLSSDEVASIYVELALAMVRARAS